jgi:hypothetical protein
LLLRRSEAPAPLSTCRDSPRRWDERARRIVIVSVSVSVSVSVCGQLVGTGKQNPKLGDSCIINGERNPEYRGERRLVPYVIA